MLKHFEPTESWGVEGFLFQFWLLRPQGSPKILYSLGLTGAVHRNDAIRWEKMLGEHLDNLMTLMVLVILFPFFLLVWWICLGYRLIGVCSDTAPGLTCVVFVWWADLRSFLVLGSSNNGHQEVFDVNCCCDCSSFQWLQVTSFWNYLGNQMQRNYIDV